MSSIPLKDIYQQKLNFIIGAGASSGLFPTLWLSLKDSSDPDKEETIETLATKLDGLGEEYKHHHTLLFMYYFQKIIEPVCRFTLNNVLSSDPDGRKAKVIENYKVFLDSLIRLVREKKQFERRCNLFTTNYDGCIPLVADELIKEGELEFSLNDGSTGFIDKTLAARNFNNYICRSGVFGKNTSDIPQINFINLHGSAYWRKHGEQIKVNYSNIETGVVIPDVAKDKLQELDSILHDENKSTADFLAIEVSFSEEITNEFWQSYNKLPIVNPTKWKFHETVFEEHYYQMLRLLSYQLEEPNSILISFAFSFADEHILNLVKRSLSNRKLKVFICCFNEKEYKDMETRFKSETNVELISIDGENLDFTNFNEHIFNAEALREPL
jgi:hypothetical protein